MISVLAKVECAGGRLGVDLEGLHNLGLFHNLLRNLTFTKITFESCGLAHARPSLKPCLP